MAKTLTDDFMKWTLDIDGQPAMKALGDMEQKTYDLEKANKGLATEMAKLQAHGKQGSAEWKALDAQMKINKSTINSAKKRMKELREEVGLNALTATQTRKAIKGLNAQMNNLTPQSKDWKKLNNQLIAHQKHLANSRGGMVKLNGVFGSFKKLAPWLGLASVAAGLKSVFNNAIETRKEYSRYEAILKVSTGSQKAAQVELDKLQKFAADTPFQLSELTGAYVKLTNYGLKPTMEEMRKQGDLAASVGKSYDQLAEAQADAVTGEFERLKEFGIKAKKEGDKITFTFKEQSTEIDNNAKSIKNYINSLGDLEGVKGSMAEISKTLGGAMSNAADNTDVFWNAVGKRLEPALVSLMGVYGKLIGKATEFIEGHKKLNKGAVTLTATVVAYTVARKIAKSWDAIHYGLLIAQGTATKALAFTQGVLTGKIKLATAAQKIWNLAAKANPYVFFATLMTGVITSLVLFSKKANNATTAQERLNETLTNAKKAADAEIHSVTNMISIINNESIARNQRNKMLERFKELAPEQLSALTLENVKTKDSIGLINEYIAAKKQQVELNELIAKKEGLQETLDSAQDNENDISGFKKFVIRFGGGDAKMIKEDVIAMNKEIADQAIEDIANVDKAIEELLKPKEGSIIPVTNTSKQQKTPLKDAPKAAKNINIKDVDLDALFDREMDADLAAMLSKEKAAAKKKGEALIKEYQSYTDQRLAIEKKYNNDIGVLKVEKGKDGADTSSIDASIAQAIQKKGKALMTFDLGLLQQSPEYQKAFEDLGNTSSETLTLLLAELENVKGATGEALSPESLREYSDTVQSIIDELGNRDPFTAFKTSIEQLTIAKDNMTKADAELLAIQNGERIVVGQTTDAHGKITQKYLSEAAAMQKVAATKDDYYKAANKVKKSEEEVLDIVSELGDALSGVGSALGGTTGEIISLMGDITSFVSYSIDGMSAVSQTGAAAISAVEKASVILGIIAVAIQLIQQISDVMSAFVDDSNLELQEKIDAINTMRDAMNQYKLAVLEAQQAEASWFGDDDLKGLANQKESQLLIESQYFDKLKEVQRRYRDEAASKWLSARGDGYAVLEKEKDEILGTETSARDNLRIETQAADKGFLGWGKKDQHTVNLEDYLKDQLGDDFNLFDDDGWLDTEAYQAVMDNYGDKLVGQTAETLEELAALKEQHDEYIAELQSYVNSMYSPLVDNMVDGIWDAMLDDSISALDAMKEYSASTFEDIIKDMIKTMVMDKIFGTFSEDISGMYEEFNASGQTEDDLKSLNDKVAARTAELNATAEVQIPIIENITKAITTNLNDETGIDVTSTDTTSSAQSATSGGFETMSQDTGSELNGRFTAIQASNEVIKLEVITIKEKMAEFMVFVIYWNEYFEDIRDDLASIKKTLEVNLPELVKYAKEN